MESASGDGKRPRKERIASRRHPLLRGRPRGQWYPDLVGRVPGYPKTEEDWRRRSEQCRAQITRLNAEGKVTRKGVPDGWAGRKEEAVQAREQAHREAKEIVKLMVEKEMVDETVRGDEALEYAIGVVRDPTEKTREKLAAARLVLDFTKAKPAQKSDVTVRTAEDFLDALAQEAIKD